MTTNQIAYWQNIERERANRAQEDISRFKAQEEARHNVESEIASYMKALADNDATIAGSALSALSPYLRNSNVDISAFQDAAMTQSQQGWSHDQAKKVADIFGALAKGMGQLNPFKLG